MEAVRIYGRPPCGAALNLEAHLWKFVNNFQHACRVAGKVEESGKLREELKRTQKRAKGTICIKATGALLGKIAIALLSRFFGMLFTRK
jgi:hypothetical protein